MALFTGLAPNALSVLADAGLIFKWGALDFAGGTVVHINAGAAALVAAIRPPTPSRKGRSGTNAPTAKATKDVPAAT